MAEIETNDFVVAIDGGPRYADEWERRLRHKIAAAKDGDTLIVRSGLQEATAHALLTRTEKKLKVVKR